MATAAVDLEIRVELIRVDREEALRYVLHSPSRAVSFHYETIPGAALVGNLEVFGRTLFEQLDRLHRGVDFHGDVLILSEVEGELEDLGRELYMELFPPQMRVAYRRIRNRVKTVQITSDEPWIPWELVKPFELDEPAFEDDFLCMQFQFARWLAGDRTPPEALKVAPLVCVETGTEGAAAERELLAGLARRLGVEFVCPPAQYRAVDELLKAGGFGLLHFAGHGNDSSEKANESRILLEDRSMTARRLLRFRMQDDRPLIFFNACRAARPGWALTGLGGWARNWIRCGCGAFLGAQWTINGRLAQTFAESFYAALENGETFAQATCSARWRLRKDAPGQPTWLAYSLYAHPNGRLAPEASTAEPEPSETGQNGVSDTLPSDRSLPEAGSSPQMSSPFVPSRLLAPLRRFAAARPGAAPEVAVLAIVALLAGLAGLGLRAHREREFLIQIETLDYPAAELLFTGAHVIWSLPWKALAAVALGNEVVKVSTVALVAMLAGWLWLSRWRRLTSGLLLVLLGLSAFALGFGSLVYANALRAIHLDAAHPMFIAVTAWLTNDAPLYDGLRESLNGLVLWLLLAALAGGWAGTRIRGRRGAMSYVGWGLVAVHLLVVLFLLDKLPLAHAYGRWGLKYPRVTAFSPKCEQARKQGLDAEDCLVYDVTAGAVERRFRLVGSCDGQVWTPGKRCSLEIDRRREVVGSWGFSGAEIEH